MADSAILRQLATYVLPHGNPEYRWRIGAALAFLIASKGLNVAVRIHSGLLVEALEALGCCGLQTLDNVVIVHAV